MFQTLADTTIEFRKTLNIYSNSSEPADIRELLRRFTTDAIASSAFGIDCNSLKNPNSEFFLSGKKFMDDINKRITVSFLVPHKILHFFNVSLMAASIEKYFIGAIKEIVEHREKNNIIRKDIMQQLIQLKNRGEIADTKIINDSNKTGDYLSITQVAAQCFVFFLGGFDTSATAMAMGLLELSLNQDIQHKLRKEIRSELKETDGNITYDAVMRMKYLDCVVNGKYFYKIHLNIKLMYKSIT